MPSNFSRHEWVFPATVITACSRGFLSLRSFYFIRIFLWRRPVPLLSFFLYPVIHSSIGSWVLIYSVGDNPTPPLSIFLLRLFPLKPLSFPTGPCLCPLSSLLCLEPFLTFRLLRMLKLVCVFPAPSLKAATSPRSSGSFCWRMVFRNQHLWAGCARYSWGDSISRPSQGQSLETDICVLIRAYPRFFVYFCFYLLSTICHLSTIYLCIYIAIIYHLAIIYRLSSIYVSSMYISSIIYHLSVIHHLSVYPSIICGSVIKPAVHTDTWNSRPTIQDSFLPAPHFPHL